MLGAPLEDRGARRAEPLPERLVELAPRGTGRLPLFHQRVERLGRAPPVLRVEQRLGPAAERLLLSLGLVALQRAPLEVERAAVEEVIERAAEAAPQDFVEIDFRPVGRLGRRHARRADRLPLFAEPLERFRGRLPRRGVLQLLGAAAKVFLLRPLDDLRVEHGPLHRVEAVGDLFDSRGARGVAQTAHAVDVEAGAGAGDLRLEARQFVAQAAALRVGARRGGLGRGRRRGIGRDRRGGLGRGRRGGLGGERRGGLGRSRPFRRPLGGPLLRGSCGLRLSGGLGSRFGVGGRGGVVVAVVGHGAETSVGEFGNRSVARAMIRLRGVAVPSPPYPLRRAAHLEADAAAPRRAARNKLTDLQEARSPTYTPVVRG